MIAERTALFVKCSMPSLSSLPLRNCTMDIPDPFLIDMILNCTPCLLQRSLYVEIAWSTWTIVRVPRYFHAEGRMAPQMLDSETAVNLVSRQTRKSGRWAKTRWSLATMMTATVTGQRQRQEAREEIQFDEGGGELCNGRARL